MKEKEENKRGRRKGSLSYEGGVREVGGVWYARLRWEGKDIRVSSKSPRKSDATALLKDLRRQVRDGTYRPGAARVTLADLKAAVVADYKANGRRSADRIEGLFKNLERVLGADTPAKMIGPKIPGYVAKRLGEKRPNSRKPGEDAKTKKAISRATINRELAGLKRGFHLLVKTGQLASMPTIELLEEGPPRKGFPEPKEIEDIIENLQERLKAPVRFLSITGWRVRETLGLEWRNVDLKAGTIRLESDETKGREIREYPFSAHPGLKALILERKAVTDAWQREHGQLVSWVFWHEDTDEGGRKAAMPNRAYQHAWASAVKKAGKPGRLIHDLRRFAARNLVRAGVSETVAMDLLGHKTPSVFRRYNVTDDRDRRTAVESLAHAQAATEDKAKEA